MPSSQDNTYGWTGQSFHSLSLLHGMADPCQWNPVLVPVLIFNSKD